MPGMTDGSGMPGMDHGMPGMMSAADMEKLRAPRARSLGTNSGPTASRRFSVLQRLGSKAPSNSKTGLGTSRPWVSVRVA
jgi:hypothetical protein